MSLERFRRSRIVVLRQGALAYQAARAMADNHIGAVLVSGQPGLVGIVTDRDLALAVLGGELDPKGAPLHEVMSEGVVTVDIDSGLDEVVGLMQKYGIRRVPVTEGGRPVGLVTFDDLVLDGSVSPDDLRAIVMAQLEVEAPLKPAGALHPRAPVTAEGRARALMRAKGRAESTYNRMVAAVADATGLDRGRAERALLMSTCMLCRRLTTDEALHLIAQLPSLLQMRLDDCLDGPDRSVTIDSMRDELARSLAVTGEEASAYLHTVFEIMSESISVGQVREVRSQLPEAMRTLIPAV